MIFHHYFDWVKYLIIKFILKIHNYIKTNDENSSSIFFNIDYDVTTTMQSLKLKFNLSMQNKMTNYMMG
jgi:hypothetical protein